MRPLVNKLFQAGGAIAYLDAWRFAADVTGVTGSS